MRHQFRPADDVRQMLGMAVELHQAGQLGRAKALYEQILMRDPVHADALQFLGLLTFQNGDADAARRLIEQAIAVKPEVAPYHDNLGKVLESQGRLEEALRAFERAAVLEPGIADRSFNMGLVSQRLGRMEDAERLFRDALDRNPSDAEYHFHLANVLKSERRYDDAIASYRQAISLRPDEPDIVSNLGHAMILAGDVDGAIVTLKRGIEAAPSHSGLNNSLGNAHRQAGQLDAAVSCYRRALEIDPASLEARRNLGMVLLLEGQFDEAVRIYLQVRGELRSSSTLRREFVAAARYLLPVSHSPALESAIGDCLGCADVHPQLLAHLAAREICLKHDLDAAAADDIQRVLPALVADPLLRRLLESTINVEPNLERALTEARRGLMAADAVDAALPANVFEFTCALGHQCFANEFVYAESAFEAAQVSRLTSEIEGALARDDTSTDALSGRLAQVAMYRPLHALPFAASLRDRVKATWPAALGSLIERTLLEPMEEIGLASSIGRATPVSDPISNAVRAQYEAHPYPRWLHLPSPRRESYAAHLKRRFPHFEPPHRLASDVNVLVLGCGTGQEAIAAATGRVVAQVTAVDLSLASLAYGNRMARKHGIERIEFLQADGLALDRLDRQFDVIECSGVLHHMSDPMAGWRTACNCLAPGGVMKVGLYSERARAGVIAARRQIADLGLEADSNGIRAFRRRVFDAPPGDPLAGLAGSEDLYTMSACRDLLFHVCEHRFGLPQIREALNQLGLRFIGFELPHAFFRARYAQFNPADRSMTDLSVWDRFETEFPDTFAAMYVFWCHKPA